VFGIIYICYQRIHVLCSVSVSEMDTCAFASATADPARFYGAFKFFLCIETAIGLMGWED
jgi:hypothetical protein